MATTAFAWTNSAVRTTGVLTDNGTFLSRSSKYFAGKNNEFAVNFTGTDLSFDYCSVSSTSGIQLSLDGAAWTTPTLTTGTGSWKTLAAVAGASDTTHTLVIRDNGSSGSLQTIFDFTNGFSVTGAAPAVAAPTGYGTVQQLSTAVAAGHIKITSGTASSGSQGNTSYGDAQYTLVGFRLVGTISTLKIFAYCNGKKLRLAIDNVNEASAVTLPNTTKWEWVTVATGLDSAASHEYRITAGDVSVIFFAVMATGGTGISTSTLAAKSRIAVVGDSITDGRIGTSNDATLSYGYLISLALDMGVANFGWSSTTLKDWTGGGGGANVTTQSGQARASAIAATTPHTVIMLYGVNDAAVVAGTTYDPAAFETAAAATLTTLLGGSPTKIHVLGILNTTNVTAAANRTEYNSRLQAAVATAGGVCQYFSTDGWFDTADSSDGLHPDANGYADIKTAYLAAIAESSGDDVIGTFDDWAIGPINSGIYC